VNRRSIHRLSIARAWIALPGLLVGGVAPSARAQVFDAEYSGAIGGSFGSSAARVGDVDGDGCDDLVIGEPDWSTFQQGRAVIYSGKTHAQITYFYGNSASRTGAAVDGKIDADGDGHPDVLIGAPDDSTAGNHAGAVHVFSTPRPCSGLVSANVPLTSLPVLVALGSATLSVASPAEEVTVAVVAAV